MKVGIFGGSFNPIHTGHAIIASHIMRHGGLDQLWLMVSPQNPLKQSHELASEVDRLRMTELVSRHINGVITSAFEFQLPRPSYTIDTLNALQQKFPQHEFHLVIGADNWAEWDRWRAHDEIVERFHVLVYPRLCHEMIIPPFRSCPERCSRQAASFFAPVPLCSGVIRSVCPLFSPGRNFVRPAETCAAVEISVYHKSADSAKGKLYPVQASPHHPA